MLCRAPKLPPTVLSRQGDGRGKSPAAPQQVTSGQRARRWAADLTRRCFMGAGAGAGGSGAGPAAEALSPSTSTGSLNSALGKRALGSSPTSSPNADNLQYVRFRFQGFVTRRSSTFRAERRAARSHGRHGFQN